MYGGNKNISACNIFQGQINPHYVEACTNSVDNVIGVMQNIYLFKITGWNCTFLEKQFQNMLYNMAQIKHRCINIIHKSIRPFYKTEAKNRMSAHDAWSTAGAQPYFQKGTTRIASHYDHNRPNSSTREAKRW